jgi:hypothetical protein
MKLVSAFSQHLLPATPRSHIYATSTTIKNWPKTLLIATNRRRNAVESSCSMIAAGSSWSGSSTSHVQNKRSGIVADKNRGKVVKRAQEKHRNRTSSLEASWRDLHDRSKSVVHWGAYRVRVRVRSYNVPTKAYCIREHIEYGFEHAPKTTPSPLRSYYVPTTTWRSYRQWLGLYVRVITLCLYVYNVLWIMCPCLGTLLFCSIVVHVGFWIGIKVQFVFLGHLHHLWLAYEDLSWPYTDYTTIFLGIYFFFFFFFGGGGYFVFNFHFQSILHNIQDTSIHITCTCVPKILFLTIHVKVYFFKEKGKVG